MSEPLRLIERPGRPLGVERPLELRLQKQQGRAFLTPATEVLYGGAAGGGKSHLMRAAAISWCMAVPGLQVYLFRRLFPELVANHMQGPTGFPMLLAPLTTRRGDRPPFCRIVKNEIRFRNGARIFLRHCQHESDVLSYQGAEIHALLIDELTHWTEGMYNFLRGRCRMTGIEVPARLAGQFPRILMGTNPGGIGHHWVKKRFVDAGPYRLRKMPPKQGGMLRTFVPARLADNPALMRADPHYADKLSGLGDPLLVKAMKEGDWKIVAGAMFGAVWRDDRHTCLGFPIPETWLLWRGADDGFASPAACYWLTRDPDTGTVYVVNEIYAAGMLPDTYATRVLAIDKALLRSRGEELFPNQHALDGIMDSAAFAQTGQQDDRRQRVPSRGEQMNGRGCRFRPAEKPPGSRVHRVQEFHRLLAPNKKDPRRRPGIIFFHSCRHAIDTIPTLPRDKDNPEDVDTEAEDHAFDAVSYGLQRIGAGFKAVKVRGI